MKPHVIIGFTKVPTQSKHPYWGEVIERDMVAPTWLTPSVDKVFAEYNIPVFYTKEFTPKEHDWSAEERESGLHLYYRVIAQNKLRFPSELLERLQQLEEVESVEIGHIAAADLPPLAQASQHQNARYDAPREVLNLPFIHRFYSKGHPEIKVAVLDTGVDLSHPELIPVLEPGFDFVNIIDGAEKFTADFLDMDEDPSDAVGHGTHVAGIIAGKGLRMPPGVVPECKIIPVRVLGALKKGTNSVGAGLIDNINSGIKWAVDQGADVINMSLGIRHTGGGLPHERVIEYAKRKGVVVVAASGNDGKEEKYYPGSLPHVIAVGAMDREMNQVAAFSTFGEQVDFVAPGTHIYSTFLNGGYAHSTGTSHAAPFVAGAAALLKSYAKEKGHALQDHQIKYLFKYSSDRIGKNYKDLKYGYGQINLRDALQLMKHKMNLN